MKKEDVYLDLTKLTREQLNNIEKVLKINKEIINIYDRKLSKKGFHEINKYPCLAIDYDDEWVCFSRSAFSFVFKPVGNKTEISYDQFINLLQDEEEINARKECLNNCFGIDLKVGKTFELKGYICECKEKVEEKKWYKVYTKERVAFEKYTKKDLENMKHMKVNFEEITDYHFINLLEKNSK